MTFTYTIKYLICFYEMKVHKYYISPFMVFLAIFPYTMQGPIQKLLKWVAVAAPVDHCPLHTKEKIHVT